MKRIGFLYEKIADEENIRRAIHNAAKGKRKRRFVRKVLEDEDWYVAEIARQLREKSFRPGRNRQKTVTDHSSGKIREITVPPFYPDQIVHWAVMQVVEPVLQRGMYRYSCGSVRGRGGVEAFRYCRNMLKQKKCRYILKMDIRHFFPSVDHDKLLEKLGGVIKDKDTMVLLEMIIRSGGPGLPIGYYTSQALSNFYLQSADHFIKQGLCVPYYVRYVDDMVLAGQNKRELKKAGKRLMEWLRQNLGLEVKETWQLWKKGERPLDFVGYRFYNGFIRLRKRTFLRLMRTVRRVRKHGLNGPRSRRLLSLLAWCKRINFRRVYIEQIRPVIRKRTARRYLSLEAQRHLLMAA